MFGRLLGFNGARGRLLGVWLSKVRVGLLIGTAGRHSRPLAFVGEE